MRLFSFYLFFFGSISLFVLVLWLIIATFCAFLFLFILLFMGLVTPSKVKSNKLFLIDSLDNQVPEVSDNTEGNTDTPLWPIQSEVSVAVEC